MHVICARTEYRRGFILGLHHRSSSDVKREKERIRKGTNLLAPRHFLPCGFGQVFGLRPPGPWGDVNRFALIPLGSSQFAFRSFNSFVKPKRSSGCCLSPAQVDPANCSPQPHLANAITSLRIHHIIVAIAIVTLFLTSIMAGFRMPGNMLLVLAVLLVVLPHRAVAFGAGNIPSIAQVEGHNWRHGGW